MIYAHHEEMKMGILGATILSRSQSDTGSVDSAQQLDPGPQENHKMSPPRGEHARENTNREVHGVADRFIDFGRRQGHGD
jgi:hypothetical protein